jgi:hypothetical protein
VTPEGRRNDERHDEQQMGSMPWGMALIGLLLALLLVLGIAALVKYLFFGR